MGTQQHNLTKGNTSKNKSNPHRSKTKGFKRLSQTSWTHFRHTTEIEAEQDATMVQQNYRNSCHSGLPKPKVQQRTTSSAGHNPARDPIDPSDPTDLRVPGYDMSTGA